MATWGWHIPVYPWNMEIGHLNLFVVKTKIMQGVVPECNIPGDKAPKSWPKKLPTG